MPRHSRNTNGLKKFAADKSSYAVQRADEAIRRLSFQKQAVNFNSVAKEAGVSKTFLYKNEPLRIRIEQLRSNQALLEKLTQAKHSVSEKGKDVIIAAKNKRIAELEAENIRLNSILRKKLGQEYDEL